MYRPFSRQFRSYFIHIFVYLSYRVDEANFKMVGVHSLLHDYYYTLRILLTILQYMGYLSLGPSCVSTEMIEEFCAKTRESEIYEKGKRSIIL